MINFKWNLFARLGYSKEERESLKLIQLANGEMLECLERIIKDRLKDTKPSEKLTEERNYPAKRALLDGRAYELEWLLKLLTEGDSDE